MDGKASPVCDHCYENCEDIDEAVRAGRKTFGADEFDDLTTPMYRERVGKCDGCGDHELLASHDNDYLCHGCWHAARERQTPYALVRVYPAGIHPDHPDGYVLSAAGCNGVPMTVTLWQAMLMLANECARADPNSDWDRRQPLAIREWHCWTGERMAHPAYGNRRRASLLAQHPEYA